MNHPLNETRISIRGESIQLRTDLDAAKLKRLTTHVTDTMDRLDPKEVVPVGKLSLLASLTLAEEVFDARDEQRDLVGHVTARVGKLNAMLDEALENE